MKKVNRKHSNTGVNGDVAGRMSAVQQATHVEEQAATKPAITGV
jgi:hypothetical protein